MRTTSQRGFTYLTVLIAVAVAAVAATATVQLGDLVQRRDAELEMLAIGRQFRAALVSYANASPPGAARAPATLEDLLLDRRYPATRRHLRRVFVDPLTGRATWGLLPGPDGKGIVGIHSLAPGRPVKVDNFPPGEEALRNRTSYRDWVFMVPAQSAQ